MLIAIIVLGQLNVRLCWPANAHHLIASLALNLLKELDDTAALFAFKAVKAVLGLTYGEAELSTEWAISFQPSRTVRLRDDAMLFEHFEDWAIRGVHGWASVVGAVMGIIQ